MESKPATITEGKLEFCANTDIQPWINKAINIGNTLHDLFKTEYSRIIKCNFDFENSTIIESNIGDHTSLHMQETFPKLLLIVHTPHENETIHNFLIEVNIILNSLTVYKFDMRWVDGDIPRLE